jgi:hypothetical protein
MSSLMERIARRRRATASSRLGPRSQPVNGREPPRSANGAAPELDVLHEPEPVIEPPAPPEPEPQLEHQEPPPATWVEDEDVWEEPAPRAPVEEPAASEPEPHHEPDPEPEYAAPPAPRRRARPAAAPTHVGLTERAQMRRRARYLRRLREVQLRDLGGFVLELNRFGRERPDLVAAKLRAAAGTDEELRALEIALDGRASVRELREAGIGGACAECGAVFGSADRFCASCGEPLSSELDHHHGEPHDERPR